MNLFRFPSARTIGGAQALVLAMDFAHAPADRPSAYAISWEAAIEGND